MKNLLILGAGTAGTMMVNHLNRKLNKKDWKITVVDQHKTHYYQPGFLFIPFDIYKEKDVIKMSVSDIKIDSQVAAKLRRYAFEKHKKLHGTIKSECEAAILNHIGEK